MTDTIYKFPSDGSSIARGRSLIANGGTITTGVSLVGGIILTTEHADTVATATSISYGVVTVALTAAGSGATGNKYVNWEAWDIQKV